MRIGILGPLEVLSAGGPVEVGGARLRALLTLLALETGRVVPAERLIDDLWEADPPAGAPNALQSLVSRLRAALGNGREVLESHPTGYRLNVARRNVDAFEFEERVAEARRLSDPEPAAAGLRAALELWRGPALADVAGQPFAEGPIARLEGLRRSAIEERIDADLRLGRHAELVPELAALTAADPLREPLRGRLMRALYGAGRQADALGVYEETKQLLAERLGVDPSAELEAVYLAVLRHDPVLQVAKAEVRVVPPPAEAPPTNLRAQLTSFIGRDADLNKVRKLLGEARLVTLTGPGGAGKTRLSVEAAARLHERLPDGVWLVELAPVADPAEVPHAVLSVLGLRDVVLRVTRSGGAPVELVDPLDRLCGALADRRLLLVLDNCEHLIDTAAALADRLLASCPRVRILATSREPLGITGETLWPVEPLELPAVGVSAPEALGFPAVRLLADRAAAVRPGFEVTEANVADVVAICRALDGMPLAIELAAARLRALTPAAVAARLGDRFRLLTAGSRTALPRHQTLRAVVEWSWDLLDQAERDLWRALSIFAGGATLESIGSVERAVSAARRDGEMSRGGRGVARGEGGLSEKDLGGSERRGGAARDEVGLARGEWGVSRGESGGLGSEGVLAGVVALVDKSLLIATEDGRFRMLETIREYGLERLAGMPGEEERLRRAHAEYFLELAESAEPLLRSREQVAAFGRLAEEHDNLHAALRWAVQARESELASRLCAALGWYWWLCGNRAEGAEAASQVLAMENLPETEATAMAFTMAAVTSFGGSRDNEVVKGWLTRGRDLVNRLRERQTVHPFLMLIGPMVDLFETGAVDGAFAEIVELFDAPDPWLRGMARFMYGQGVINAGRAAEADEQFHAALREFRTAGERWGTAFTLASLAEARAWRGEHEAAAALVKNALAVLTELHTGDDLPYFHARLAHQLWLIGDREGHEETIKVAVRIAERAGSPDALGMIRFHQARLARFEGRVEEAAALIDAAISLFDDRRGAPQFHAMLLGERGSVHIAAGELDTARPLLDAAVQKALGSMDSPVIAGTVGAQAELAWAEGDPVRAAELLGAAERIRGCLDLSLFDVVTLTAKVRDALGADFDACYARGMDIDREALVSYLGLQPPALDRG